MVNHHPGRTQDEFQKLRRVQESPYTHAQCHSERERARNLLFKTLDCID